jgi:hypothetical protein
VMSKPPIRTAALYVFFHLKLFQEKKFIKSCFDDNCTCAIPCCKSDPSNTFVSINYKGNFADMPTVALLGRK